MTTPKTLRQQVEAVRKLHHRVERAISGGQITGPNGRRSAPVTYIRSCSCGKDFCAVLVALEGVTP